MNRITLTTGIAMLLATTLIAEDASFKDIFDGKTLDGWKGSEKFWSVEDGSITGSTTENKTSGNTFLIYTNGDIANFELTFDYRFLSNAGNSGVQYRSEELPNFVVKGYQADFEAGTKYSGILYGEKTGRGIMSNRGKKTWLGDGSSKTKVETIADSNELQKLIKPKGEWNSYHIIADGNHFTHTINGAVMSETFDESEKDFKASGILALQVHAGPPMKLQFRNLKLKTLK
ncbi:MAG: DUF1080 domain-containing protein [Kiritimatiellae bacterium]|nr:DUF1080 domain-containing protein [Kiritimatiellia bacterium]